MMFYAIPVPLVPQHINCTLLQDTRAGRSPTFQDPGTPLVGLAGTWVPASSIESLVSPLMWTRTRESH